ncbi:hypothetical protein PR048_032889 [Dryococelus australis]|uniref:Uncharacterized protein n=1 Tax=Dryococelus australis TaxID=614101 RepID=A0ABQ9G6F5_9NEOP|nr:hypothetical protein PR048_032889 [Dryococelus australis]
MTDASCVITAMQHFIGLPAASIPVPYGTGIARRLDVAADDMTYARRRSASLICQPSLSSTGELWSGYSFT